MVKKNDKLADQPDLIRIPLAELTLDPTNARLHSDRQLSEFAQVLERFGQQKPIVIDDRNVVLAGNGTVLAAKRVGWESILCLRTTIKDEAERQAYAIADNRIGDLSEFDEEILTTKLRTLSAKDLLKGTGFDDDELQELNDLLAPDAAAEKTASRSIGNGTVPVVRICIAMPNVATFERAMQATGEMNRETALMKLAKFYLNATEEERQLDD